MATAPILPDLRHTSWQDRISFARVNSELAPYYIGSLRDEAEALAKTSWHNIRDEYLTIAEACGAYLDSLQPGCPWNPESYLDDLDYLVIGAA